MNVSHPEQVILHEVPDDFVEMIRACNTLELATLRRDLKICPEDAKFLKVVDDEIRQRTTV